MDLHLLRTFLAVYRAGTLTGAAAQSGLSQPTVTAHLRALEEQLGQQLFVRLPRGVAPTTVAEELAAQVAAPLDALEAVADRGLASPETWARPVHLAGPAELTAALVLPALAGLVTRGLRLRTSLGLSQDLLDGLPSGRFDLVISTIRPRVRGVTAAPLTDEELVLVAAPSRASRVDRARLAREGPARLAGVPLVAYAEDLPLIRRYWRSVFDARPGGDASVVVPDLRAVMAATEAGAGITVLPRYLCAGQLAAGSLVLLLDPVVPPINTLYLATRAGSGRQPHVDAVREHLLSAARGW
ncbi:LysR family transcriptional regulator [Oryzihumus leptocrescens]|uniref:DNA-binding transcriptional LysR family regulator n=1 Tax=Oryzihumus leptocrescens TaxID=297536 RepID=A0A542ZLS3_9MICO|nr:LysR family transcriptional regulator [Oryzihumus leptocrescens]TQL61271.1 DNA-binding transcriptional LysR family regulator [Oryzihumus leptocrescens]